MSPAPREAIGAGILGFYLLVCSGILLRAADSVPFIAIPARAILTNANHFIDRTKTPQMGLSSFLGESPATATNFYALGWDEISSQGTVPDVPDTYGAVSKDFFVTMLNSEVRIQTRTGQEVQRVPLHHWWTNGHPELLDFNVIVDPRILYDPFHDRWIATVLVKTNLAPLTNAGNFGRSFTIEPPNKLVEYL